MDRYHRQILLPQIRPAGQERIRAATVMLVGVGALGCTVADQLCRAGVGKLILVDRDVVDVTNLHRQNLFTEADARHPSPKAQVAALACRAANPDCEVIELITDISSDNALRIVDQHQPDLIIDSTDNVGTRFLLNDVAVSRGLPLIYGGCVGTEGRVLGIVPSQTPCLRCLFPTPPTPADLATCDTVGVLGPAAAVVGAIQAAEALKLIVNGPKAYAAELITVDLWSRRFRSIEVSDSREPGCVACGQRRFDYLNAVSAGAVSLCGRATVQVKLVAGVGSEFLVNAERKLRSVSSSIMRNEYLVHCQLDDALVLDVFADGRVLVHGTGDCVVARAVVARYLG